MGLGSFGARRLGRSETGGERGIVRVGTVRITRPVVAVASGVAVIATVVAFGVLGTAAGAATTGSTVTLAKTVSKDTQASHAPVTWTIDYSCSSTVNPTCDGLVITDVLPAGLLLDAADVGLTGDSNVTGKTYDPTTGTAKFTLKSALPVGTTGQVKITVKTPVGTTKNNLVTANTATATCTNCDAPATSNASPVTWTATPSFREIKLVYSASGTKVTYQIDPLPNSYEGNRDLDDVFFTDVLPAGTVYQANSCTQAAPNVTCSFDAATNTVTWHVLHLAVTKVPELRVTVDLAGLTTGTDVVNKVTAFGTNPDSQLRYDLPPAQIGCVIGTTCLPQPAINVSKVVLPPADSSPGSATGAFEPGSTVTFQITASVATTTALQDPTFVDYAPAGFTFVPGSVKPANAATPNPSSTPVAVDVLGKQAITILNTGKTLPAGVNFQYTIQFVIGPDVVPGSYSNGIYVGSDKQAAVAGYVCNGSNPKDNPGFAAIKTPGLKLCYNSAAVSVQQASGLVATKDGRGENDTAWQAYPSIGHTSPGGNAQWRVTLTNPSAQSFKNINVLDILPSTTATGDTEVLSGVARGSKFATTLTAQVDATAGQLVPTVKYTTVTNPCRRSVLPNSTYESPGCNTPTWSTVFPTSAPVTALWFNITGPLQTNAKAQFTLTYKVPASTTVGDIAWNSLAFNADTNDGEHLLPAEPLKVGISVTQPTVTPTPTPATPTPAPATPTPVPTATPGGSGVLPIEVEATPTPTPAPTATVVPVAVVSGSGVDAVSLANTGTATYGPLVLGSGLLIGGLGVLLAAGRRRRTE